MSVRADLIVMSTVVNVAGVDPDAIRARATLDTMADLSHADPVAVALAAAQLITAVAHAVSDYLGCAPEDILRRTALAAAVFDTLGGFRG